ncbi:MAG: C39 family peptidase [Thermoplasmatota archaeon]
MWRNPSYSVFIIIFLALASFAKGVPIQDKLEDGLFLGYGPDKTIHIISEVPYVSQETDFYCTYACPTMILKYYGCDTNIYEVLFSSGAGYSVVYSHPIVKRFIISCVGTSNWEADRRFLGSLFGLSYEEYSFLQYSLSEQQCWEAYWEKIKEHVSNDTPIITIVDPSALSSVQSAIQQMLGVPDMIWDRIPAWAFRMFPSTMTHMIVVVGYNEENGTICYHDPSTVLLGDASFGTYAWMNLSDFQRSMQDLSSVSSFAYLVGVFKDSGSPRYNQEQRFSLAQCRNLEKMQGNPASYDERILFTWNVSDLGINGLKQLYADLGTGIQHRPTTIILYKLLSSILFYSLSYKVYRFFDRFSPEILNLSDFNEQMNYLHQLSIEKRDVSNWLSNHSGSLMNESLKMICSHDASLLKNESNVCKLLAENFSIFLQKGLWIRHTKALDITNNMQILVSLMIAIEESIIDGK